MNKTNESCVGFSTSGGRFPRARAELTRTSVRVDFGTSLSRRQNRCSCIASLLRRKQVGRTAFDQLARRLPLRILKPAACTQQLSVLPYLFIIGDAPDRVGHETPSGNLDTTRVNGHL